MRYNRLYKDNNFLTPTTYTQELSEYAEGLKYEDLPPEVVERAKMIMLQTVGAALAAKGTPIYGHYPVCVAGGRGAAQEREGPDYRYRDGLRGLPAHCHGGAAL